MFEQIYGRGFCFISGSVKWHEMIKDYIVKMGILINHMGKYFSF